MTYLEPAEPGCLLGVSLWRTARAAWLRTHFQNTERSHSCPQAVAKQGTYRNRNPAGELLIVHFAHMLEVLLDLFARVHHLVGVIDHSRGEEDDQFRPRLAHALV